MKMASASSGKSHTVDGAKVKYQKEYVSRKRKLQAAKQKRETVSAEVRFLRHRRKRLFKGQAPNTVPNSNIQTNAVEVERSRSTFETSPRNLDRILTDECGEGNEIF